METAEAKPTSAAEKTEPPVGSPDGKPLTTSVPRPRMMLKLKSMNGAKNSMNSVSQIKFVKKSIVNPICFFCSMTSIRSAESYMTYSL